MNELTTRPRQCSWCDKPAPEGRALMSIWWCDYECCSMECVMRQEDEADYCGAELGETRSGECECRKCRAADQERQTTARPAVQGEGDA